MKHYVVYVQWFDPSRRRNISKRIELDANDTAEASAKALAQFKDKPNAMISMIWYTN